MCFLILWFSTSTCSEFEHITPLYTGKVIKMKEVRMITFITSIFSDLLLT